MVIVQNRDIGCRLALQWTKFVRIMTCMDDREMRLGNEQCDIMIGRTSSAPKGSRRARQILQANVSGYCESTTLHGFAYWVSAPRLQF